MAGNRTADALGMVDWEPLHDKVYGRIRDALMEAQFEPDAKLSLRSIAEQLGVSVMPVRAAVLRLVAEKAVYQSANGHFRVPKLEQPEFDDIVFLRAELEGLAAERAAALRTASELSQMKSAAKDLTRASKANDASTYLQANRSFKFLVVSAARMPVLQDLIESLWMRIGPFMSHYATDIRHQHEIDQHDNVVKSIEKGDGAAARKAMARDIIAGAGFLRNAAEFHDPPV